MTFIRRAILAFALIAGIVPAFAQAPPPVPALPDSERRTSYTISGTTCACSLGANLALYGDGTDYQSWVEVFINGVQVSYNDPTFGWTITSTTGPLATIPRPITNAVLTFTNAQTGTIQIVGARRPRRLSTFSENRGVPARDLNQILNDMIAQTRESWDKTNDVTGRAILGLPGETVGPLPSAAARANQFLMFNASGNPTTASPTLGLGNVVGPLSSVNNHVAVFSGTTGTVIADGGSIGSTTLTGDVTGSGTVTFATTLATVNGNVGSFGSATQCLSVTVNAKGLITAASVATCAPSFSSITGQATLAQFPNIANNTVLGNNSGGSAVPSALSPSAILDVIGSASGSVLCRSPAGWIIPSAGSSGQLLSYDTVNGCSWVTATGTGTVTSVANDGSIKSSIASNGAITATGTLGLWGEPGSITNCTLAATVSGGALTISLKGQNGSAPSASNPCIVSFRNATLTTGDYTYVQVTAATSFVTATSGSTFGASNSTAFRLWVTAWNNAGTVVLGVSRQSTASQIFSINEGALQSSTACNACGAATSAGVFYTTSAQTSLAIRILGYMDWSSGLATAGTWASSPTAIQMFGPGVKKPGDVVQALVNSTTASGTTTSASFVALTSTQSQALTPTSAANLMRVFSSGTMGNTATSVTMQIQIQRGSTLVGNPYRAATATVANTWPISMLVYDFPNTVSPVTYSYQGLTSGGTLQYPFTSTGSVLEVQEIMG